MISSPRLQTVSTMLCTELVVPPTIRKACAAPKASAASSSASRMTDTGWQRLSSGFMLFDVHTHAVEHCWPRKAVNSGSCCHSWAAALVGPAHRRGPLSHLWSGTADQALLLGASSGNFSWEEEPVMRGAVASLRRQNRVWRCDGRSENLGHAHSCVIFVMILRP